MGYSFVTDDIDSFYLLICILVNNGFILDFDYMCDYRNFHDGQFLVLVKED